MPPSDHETDGTAARTLALQRHPSTPCPHALQLGVRLLRVGADRLQMDYTLTGDCGAVLLPPRNNRPGPRDGLWQYTCMEAFLGTADHPAYRELNFSPGGDWAVFTFSDYRQRTGHGDAITPPAISTHATPRTIRVRVQLALPSLTPGPAQAPAKTLLGLGAVVEHTDGRRCYWALTHPCDDPDFHARAGWLATLPPAPVGNT